MNLRWFNDHAALGGTIHLFDQKSADAVGMCAFECNREFSLISESAAPRR